MLTDYEIDGIPGRMIERGLAGAYLTESSFTMNQKVLNLYCDPVRQPLCNNKASGGIHIIILRIFHLKSQLIDMLLDNIQ